jgi:SMC interacting uncharacterized protein involved in chromosome segregation
MTALQFKLIEARDNVRSAKRHMAEVLTMSNLDEPRGKSLKRGLILWPFKTWRQVAQEELDACRARLERIEYAVRRDRVLSKWYLRKLDQKVAKISWNDIEKARHDSTEQIRCAALKVFCGVESEPRQFEPRREHYDDYFTPMSPDEVHRDGQLVED